MNVVLIGPPGAGKGTQARRLEADFRIPHVVAEPLLHPPAGSSSPEPAGVEAEAEVAGPEERVARRVDARLQAPDCTGGFILEGFPRTQLIDAGQEDLPHVRAAYRTWRRSSRSGVMESCEGSAPTTASTRSRSRPPSSFRFAMTRGTRLSWAVGLPCQER